MHDGFVVNVYDPLNYDIDIVMITEDYHNRVMHNEYAYKSIHDGQLSNEHHSFSYRCRLNGIEINNKHYNKHQVKQTIMEIKKLIDREDGWVSCSIHGVDVFNRLLVDIYLPSLGIDLCRYLLTRPSNQLYHKYYPKRVNK